MASKKDNQVALEESVRENFVRKIKEVLPKTYVLADEISSLLNISNDSAYRRIRGETAFTLEEVYAICKEFKISMDDVFNSSTNSVTFNYTKLTASVEQFHEYFHRLLAHLNAINKAESRRITYVAEETPIFYSFFTPRLTAFKLFYWLRSVLGAAEYQNMKFDWNAVPKELVEVAHDSFKQFMNIPSKEVWTTETVLTALKQVKYYYESGVVTQEHAIEILQDYKSMVLMLQENAGAARKSPSDKEGSFELYQSEIVLGTNCIFVEVGSNKYSYISFNTVNSLNTTNAAFCEETEHWVTSLEKKSVKISGAAEKLRNRFFNTMLKYVDNYTEGIRNDTH